uniref:Uncharacterized protein n=1 Tax=Romanomermis culicivorax TaxID=13658 RepID=A0A915JRM0_ROMCU
MQSSASQTQPSASNTQLSASEKQPSTSKAQPPVSWCHWALELEDTDATSFRSIFCHSEIYISGHL